MDFVWYCGYMEHSRKEKDLVRRVELLSKAFDNLVTERNQLMDEYVTLKSNYERLAAFKIATVIDLIDKKSKNRT